MDESQFKITTDVLLEATTRIADDLKKAFGPSSAVIVMVAVQDPSGHDSKRWGWRGSCLSVEGILADTYSGQVYQHARDQKLISAAEEDLFSKSTSELSFKAGIGSAVVIIAGNMATGKLLSESGPPFVLEGLRRRCTKEILESMWRTA